MNEETKNKFYNLAEDLAERRLCKGPYCFCPAETDCSQCETFIAYRNHLADCMGVQDKKSAATIRVSFWLYDRNNSRMYPYSYSSDYKEHIEKALKNVVEEGHCLFEIKQKSAEKFTEFIKQQNLRDGEYEAEIIINVENNTDDVYLDKDEFTVLIKNKEVYFINE